MKSWRAKGGKWDQISVDVTAWGDAERNQVVKVHRREMWGRLLHDVFNESHRTGAVIVWRDGLPDMRVAHAPVKQLCNRMIQAWGKLPPHIQVVEKTQDGYGELEYHYSIKPVWEL